MKRKREIYNEKVFMLVLMFFNKHNLSIKEIRNIFGMESCQIENLQLVK